MAAGRYVLKIKRLVTTNKASDCVEWYARHVHNVAGARIEDVKYDMYSDCGPFIVLLSSDSDLGAYAGVVLWEDGQHGETICAATCYDLKDTELPGDDIEFEEYSSPWYAHRILDYPWRVVKAIHIPSGTFEIGNSDKSFADARRKAMLHLRISLAPRECRRSPACSEHRFFGPHFLPDDGENNETAHA